MRASVKASVCQHGSARPVGRSAAPTQRTPITPKSTSKTASFNSRTSKFNNRKILKTRADNAPSNQPLKYTESAPKHRDHSQDKIPSTGHAPGREFTGDDHSQKRDVRKKLEDAVMHQVGLFSPEEETATPQDHFKRILQGAHGHQWAAPKGDSEHGTSKKYFGRKWSSYTGYETRSAVYKFPQPDFDPVPHNIQVVRLYRHALRHSWYWLPQYDAWQHNWVVPMRNEFKRNKEESEQRGQHLLQKGQELLNKYKNVDPYIRPTDPEGTKWERNLPAPVHWLDPTNQVEFGVEDEYEQALSEIEHKHMTQSMSLNQTRSLFWGSFAVTTYLVFGIDW